MRVVNLYPDFREMQIMKELGELSRGGRLGPYVVLSAGEFMLGENTPPVLVELCNYEYHGQLPKEGKWLFSCRSVPEALEILRRTGDCLGWYPKKQEPQCTSWYGGIPPRLTESGD